jgi:hypothetical protein
MGSSPVEGQPGPLSLTSKKHGCFPPQDVITVATASA